MRKLHLVGVTTDLKGLIFTARKGSKSGGYLVALDRKLVEAVDDASHRNGTAPAGSRSSQSERTAKVPSPDGGAGEDSAAATPSVEPGEGRAQSALSPREMQARMRAGRSIEEVALEAGVGADWVARFAVPILAEQAQVVALARGITFAKPRLGPSALPLGEAVARNLAEKGHSLPDDLFDPAWSAFQLHDSVWTVRFRHEVRGRSYEAHWELDVATGRLLARNRVASDLGYVDPGGRKGPDGATGDHGPDSEPAPPPDPSPPGRSSRPGRPTSSGGRQPASGRPQPQVPVGTPGTRSRSAPKDGAKAAKDGGEAGPTIRGGGIRAATAQVASAQVAASRSLVARTVLPAPRPPVIRGSGTRGAGSHGGGAGRSSSRSRSGGGGKPSSAGQSRRAQGSDSRGQSAGDKNGAADRMADPDTSSDVFIGELLREPATTAEPSQAGEGAGNGNLATFQPRPRRQEPPPATVTRVRSGGPTGLVRTTSNPTGARAKEPIRVPPILSGASGPERGMPVPRGRSRRILRRGR